MIKILIMHKKGFNLFLIIIQLFLFIPLYFAEQINLRKIISSNVITLTIKGSGNQSILSDNICEKEGVNYTFEELPDEILVNGEYKGNKIKIAYNLSEEINNVTMIWNSNITNCNCMFSNLSNIISIDFSQFDTSQVTNMLYMFNGCTSLVSLDLTNFNTEKVTDMYKMFFNCSSLQILKQNFRAPLAIDISYMFYLCGSLISIDLSYFEATSALFMALMFYKCKSLITANFSNFNAEQSLFIDNMFYGCSNLKTIDFTNFKTSTVSGMGNLFYGCGSLTYLDLSSFDFSSVTNMGHMFFQCIALKSIILKNFNTSQVKVMDNMFNNCKRLNSLDLSGFNTISVTDMSYMFYGCKALTSLKLGNFNTSLVTNMKFMFYNCSSLNSLDLSSFNTMSVTDMSYMFYGCNSLTSIELGIFETNSVINMEQMFYNCSSLSSLNIEYFNTLNVNNFNEIFYNCSDNLQYCINVEINSQEFLSQLSNYSKTNCSNLCSLNSYKYNPEKNICIKYCLNDEEYQWEYNDICYSTCPNGTISYNNDKFCKSLCEKYYDYEQASCVNEVRVGYYLNNTELKTIDKCDIKCYNCTLESISIGLCVSCNIDQRFYPKMNASSNDEEFINCYNETPIGYYLDDKVLIYKPYPEKTDISEYTDFNSEITNSIDFTHENIVNSETFNGLNDNDTNDNSENIDEKYFSKNQKLIYYFYDSNSKTSNYSYEINSNINELKKLYTNLTFIELSQEAKNLIIKSNNLDEKNDKIYLIINDYPSNDSQMSINNYDYKLVLENGTEIDLSKIYEDFYADLSIPLMNISISNFNYYKIFYEQGYDIYDKNSDFYNDTCSPAYLYNNDITIEDRKKEIYPNNVTLCKSNCKYKSVVLENKKINCYCNLNINKNYTQNYEDNNFIIEENGNFFDYLLDNINYKIFKCYKLVFNIQNLIKNISFYIMILSLITIIIINIKFYICDLSKIKILSVKNSIIDKITLKKKTKQKEKHKINKNSKKNILEPIKKKGNKFKTKGIKIKPNKTETNIKVVKNVYYFSKININSSNILLKNDKSTKNFPKFKNIKIKEKIEGKKEDFNELPFMLAKKKDKRNIFEIFASIIAKKITLIKLFFGDEKIKILLLNENILSLLVNFFFNALLYSDEVVSHKYHNDGTLDFIVSLILSILSNIISSIACYFLNYSELIEERFDQILQMKKAYNYPLALTKFLKKLKLKVLIYILKEIFIILFCFYYLIIFTIVYSYSNISLLYNYLYSLIEQIIKSLIISIIVAITRKISFKFSNIYIYNRLTNIVRNFSIVISYLLKGEGHI